MNIIKKRWIFKNRMINPWFTLYYSKDIRKFWKFLEFNVLIEIKIYTIISEEPQFSLTHQQKKKASQLFLFALNYFSNDLRVQFECVFLII